MSTNPLFCATHLNRTFGHGKNKVVAVADETFDIAEGEIVSLVGESGSGKTTLAKMLLMLDVPSSGTLLFQGAPAKPQKAFWQQVQAVFQDPFASFNQFFTIETQLADAFDLFDSRPSAAEMSSRIDDSLAAVNLVPESVRGKYPFELSGGQMQRVLLARVFLIGPKVLIADEPTSMVDACSRAGILQFLLALKVKLNMTIVFVTHDIGLAYHVSDRLFIMHQGAIVERGPAKTVIESPKHPYTVELLHNIPKLRGPWLSRSRPAMAPG